MNTHKLILLLPLFLASAISSYAIDATVVNSDPENFEISWPSSAGKSYTINRSDDLTSLDGQQGGHEATPPTNSFIINASSNPNYFVQIEENVTSAYGDRSAAFAMNQRLGKGNNFMASKIQFGHAYLSDFTLLRESGFDHVRIGSNLYKYYGDGSNSYENYKTAMKTAVDLAITAGLNVIVNPVHHWANDDITDENGNLTFRFTGSTADYLKYNSIWTDIADEFKDYAIDQVVFELMNEPHREYSIAQVISEGLASVRAVAGNQQRIVIIAGGYGILPNEPANAGLTTREALIDGFDSDYFPTNDPYLIGTFHYYDPRPFTKQGNPTPGLDGVAGNPGQRWGDQSSDYNQVISDFDAIDTANLNWANRNNTTALPIYQGEFGVDNVVDTYGNGDRKRWISWVRMQCENRGYSWAHWHMYNTADNAKGLGPFDTSTSESRIYFDVDEFNANDAYTLPAVDKVYGSSSNSTWGVPSSVANGFLNLIPEDGVFQLANNGAKPAYVGGTFGNGHRTEWGLSYNGFAAEIPEADRGRIENGFNHNLGKFTIEYDITAWNLTSEDDSTVQLQARDSSGNIISSVRLVGKTNPVYNTIVTESSLVDFNLEGGAITDSVTDSDPGSLFALPTATFVANTLTDGTYKIEKTAATNYYGSSIANGNRGEWGLTYNGFGNGQANPGKINTGFNKTSGEISVELDIASWDLSNGTNPTVEFQFLDLSRSMVAKMRIKPQGGHTRLWAFTSTSNYEHLPLNEDGSTAWTKVGLKRGDAQSDSPADATTLKMKINLDDDSITLTSKDTDVVIPNVGLTGRSINSLRLVTTGFGSPDFVTIDRFRIHDGGSSSTQELIGYNNKTLVRAYDNAAFKYAEHELDSSNASGDSNHKIAINVDYDDGKYSLLVDGSSILEHAGAIPSEPIHSVRLVTSKFQNPDYVNFDSVAYYQGDTSPSTLAKTTEGFYGANFKDMPDLRYFDADPLEGLIGVYEFEDYASASALTDYKGYSSTGYVDLNQVASASLLSVYTPHQIGQNTYNLVVRYSATQDQTLSLSVNGATSSHQFLSTGSLYDWGEKVIPISLNEGEHDITFSGALSDSINLDKAHITQ
jgi:endoglucanase